MTNVVHFKTLIQGSLQCPVTNSPASWPLPLTSGGTIASGAAASGANAIRVFLTHHPAWISFGLGAAVGPNALGSILIQPGVQKFITGMVSTAQGDEYADAGNPVPGQYDGTLPPIVFDTAHPDVIYDPALWNNVLASTSFSIMGHMQGGQISIDFGTISFGRT